MSLAGITKKKYATYYNARFNLFASSYVGYTIRNCIKIRYKIIEDLTNYQLRQQLSHKRSIPEISKLSRVLVLDYQKLWQFIIFNKKLSSNSKLATEQGIKIYLEIESEMIFLSVARLNKENIVNEDYERAILAPAIERIAGNDLRNVNSDFLFNKRHMVLRREYTRLYYKVAHKYKLPTPGIRAFILRLISK